MGRALAVLIAAAALASLPALAAAKPKVEVKPKTLHLSLEAEASNGYTAQIETEGHRQVTLQLQKGGVFATYKAEGKVSRHGIEADLGRFGRVTVRFDGRRRPIRSFFGLGFPGLSPSHCKGRPPVREVGSFHGKIEFAGERGFTEIDAASAPGEVRRSYRRVCKRTKADPTFAGTASRLGLEEEDPLINELIVASRDAGRNTFFAAVGGPARDTQAAAESELAGLTIAIAGAEEKVDAVAVQHSAIIFAGPGNFVASEPGHTPTSARVKFPPPFSGKGSYLESGEPPATWEGSLSIHLPGLGLVPLSGPTFTAKLCRTRGTPDKSPCQRAAERGLPTFSRLAAVAARSR